MIHHKEITLEEAKVIVSRNLDLDWNNKLEETLLSLDFKTYSLAYKIAYLAKAYSILYPLKEEHQFGFRILLVKSIIDGKYEFKVINTTGIENDLGLFNSYKSARTVLHHLNDELEVYLNRYNLEEEKIVSVIRRYLETGFISQYQGYMDPAEWIKLYSKYFVHN
jgi:hypothetical protein